MFILTPKKYLKRRSFELSRLIIVAVLLNRVLGFTPVQAEAIEVGYKDFSMSGATSPTGQKPQSKLWFNDGIWWGILYNKASNSKHFEIYRFNWATDTWTTTGVIVDVRRKSSADALWTGSKLYTVSNVPVGQTGDVNIYVKRFSYNSTTKTYSVDSGFPVAVYNRAVETVVMDKDSTGKLWITFTDANNSGGRNAYVMHTTTNDTTWTAPYIVPVLGAATLDSDDISTIVAYNGKIGVMWSNQNNSTVYFAYHLDGTADNNWIGNPAMQSPGYADDHLNIKSLQADSSGQLFAVVKTSLDDVNPSTSTQPLILLLQLDNQGSWSRRTVWRIVDNVTRPIVLLDQQNRNIYAFATLNYGTQTNGAIYYKSTSLDNPSMQFVTGIGTPFIVSSTDTHINDASSTKQALNSTTNLLVIAGDDNSHYYFHNKIVLGTGGPTATPTNTPVPTNTATNTPTGTSPGEPSPTSTNTATNTPTGTSPGGPSATPTNTPAPTNTATNTPTGTNPGGPSATPTNTPAPTNTATNTMTPTVTSTMGPTLTATALPSQTPTFTPSPTSAVSDVIFADGFESGNFSAWTSASIDAGDLSVSPAAALVGSNGMQVLINDSNNLYVTDDTPNAEPRYRVRFYFDPNSLSMASGDTFNPFRGFMGTSTSVLQVAFRNFSGSYQLRGALLNDSAVFVTTSWITISDGPHSIELDWRAATGAGANNGSLTMWIDGVQQASLSGLDNDTWRIDRVRLGALAAISATTRSTYFLDAFESRRETYIGP